MSSRHNSKSRLRDPRQVLVYLRSHNILFELHFAVGVLCDSLLFHDYVSEEVKEAVERSRKELDAEKSSKELAERSKKSGFESRLVTWLD